MNKSFIKVQVSNIGKSMTGIIDISKCFGHVISSRLCIDIAPLLMNPENGLDGELWTNQWVELMQVDNQPEHVTADGRHHYHCLNDS